MRSGGFGILDAEEGGSWGSSVERLPGNALVVEGRFAELHHLMAGLTHGNTAIFLGFLLQVWRLCLTQLEMGLTTR
jgi:hypothetical protein